MVHLARRDLNLLEAALSKQATFSVSLFSAFLQKESLFACVTVPGTPATSCPVVPVLYPFCGRHLEIKKKVTCLYFRFPMKVKLKSR